jgi:hypothetical protein
MQTNVNILKYTVFKFQIIFRITGVLYVSPDMVVIRYFENCC